MLRLFSNPVSRNILFPFLLAHLLVLGGSLSTALFFLAAFYLIFLNPRKTLGEILNLSGQTYREMPVLWVFPIYFMCLTVTSLYGENRMDGLGFIGSYLHFLVLVPMSVGLVALSPSTNFAGVFSRGFRFALIPGLLFAAYQAVQYGLRAEGWSGNALVFGTVCVTGAGLSVLYWPQDRKWMIGVGMIAFVAGIAAGFLTGSRGILLAIFALIGFMIFHAVSGRYGWRNVLSALAMVLVAGTVLAVGLSGSFGVNRILDRKFLEPVESLLNGEIPDRSIGIRLDMQIAGMKAFMEKPVSGHGIQNVTTVADRIADRPTGGARISSYTHLHNDYLTHAVGGGLLLLIAFMGALLAPVILARGIKIPDMRHPMTGFGLITTIVFGVMALTNVVFRHDITMTLYSAAVVFIVACRNQELAGIRQVAIPNFEQILAGEPNADPPNSRISTGLK